MPKPTPEFAYAHLALSVLLQWGDGLNTFYVSHGLCVRALQWSFFIILGTHSGQLCHGSTSGSAERDPVTQTWEESALSRERSRENIFSTSSSFSGGLWTGEKPGSSLVHCASKQDSRQGVKCVIFTASRRYASTNSQELLGCILTYWKGFSYTLGVTSFLPTCPALFLAHSFCLPYVSIPVSFKKRPFVIHSVTIRHDFDFQSIYCSPSDFCCVALILLVVLVMRLISSSFRCQIFYRYLWLLQLYLLCLAPFNQPPESFKDLKFSHLKFITAACP